MDLRAPRGTRDILPEEAASRRAVERIFTDTCSRYGYGEIRVPTFEHTELFVRGVGDASDIVRKEMYTFADRSDRNLTLRPEGTAGVARAFVEQGMASRPAPIKLWYNMNMFRYEKMQKGRYREFWQFGCEVFESKNPATDAELMGLLDSYFVKLGLSDISLEINSIGCPSCREAYRKALRAYYEPELSGMCEDCHERFSRNPLRMLDCKETHCHMLAGHAPLQRDYLCDGCRAHFDQVKEYLDVLDISYEVNPRMVRGLDYYTRTVFEFISQNVGTQGTICGGGRYDGLIGEIGGPDVPAVGFAMGVERLMLELEAQGIILVEETSPDLYIASFPSTVADALLLAKTLICEGFYVETDIMGRSLRAQLKAADRLNASYVFVLGDRELLEAKGKLRRLSDGSESTVSLGTIGTSLKNDKVK
ncbi:MAG TPA: histidine--tRNA ligase [Clostridia bacterium]|nr:histidine--tRNA ligase [Clostridia bacterium]